MPSNELFIILFLQLIRSGLPDVIRRDSDINRNPLVDVIVVIVCLLFRRNEHIVFRVDGYVVPLLNLLLLLFFPTLALGIKHLLHLPLRAEVLPPHPPAALPNLLRGRTPCHDCHAGNRRQA